MPISHSKMYLLDIFYTGCVQILFNRLLLNKFIVMPIYLYHQFECKNAENRVARAKVIKKCNRAARFLFNFAIQGVILQSCCMQNKNI